MGKNHYSHSAGGVIIGSTGKVAIVSQKGRSWSLPKGHLDAGEDALSAAKREIYEETGLTTLTFIKELGSFFRYKIGKNGLNDKREYKKITLFLFTTTQTQLDPIDPKHPEAIWVDIEQVIDYLTHPKDKEFFASIIPELIDVS
tara:strand:- start:33 stop:464 length:432 start_codon:yes stop_codon:yes gene_type:complete